MLFNYSEIKPYVFALIVGRVFFFFFLNFFGGLKCTTTATATAIETTFPYSMNECERRRR